MKMRSGIVYVTADEMRKIDDLAIREFQVDVLILMENAGRAAATLSTRMLDGVLSRKRVAFLVGGGNNGGDGMVAARHLANWGAEVDVIVGGTRERIKEVPLVQLQILEKMGLRIFFEDYSLEGYDLLVDGLIGYGLEGHPRDQIASIIKKANQSGRPILAVDLPSGMNATTGEIYDPCIKATSTLTLALPKTGFLVQRALDYLGDLYVADISVPRKLYRQFGQEIELFRNDLVLKL